MVPVIIGIGRELYVLFKKFNEILFGKQHPKKILKQN
jgi:hypothetical protein